MSKIDNSKSKKAVVNFEQEKLNLEKERINLEREKPALEISRYNKSTEKNLLNDINDKSLNQIIVCIISIFVGLFIPGFVGLFSSKKTWVKNYFTTIGVILATTVIIAVIVVMIFFI